jgi:hypothetical protein
MNNTDDIIIQRKLYYDSYEKDFGDGFYPQLTPMINQKPDFITISFKLIEYMNELVWIQITGPVIYGFDGFFGIQILVSLNNELKIGAKKILNSGCRIIYPKTPNSTFRVINGI